MKKIIAILAGSMLLVPAFAFAAMPNFVGTGYKTADKCTIPPDRPIWETVGSSFVVTGCTPEADAVRADAEAHSVQTTGLRFGVGQSVALIAGGAAFCPEWFIPSAGCVIAKALVR